MAQFDVYRTRSGELLLDCQADVLDFLNTRFAVPLLHPGHAPQPAEHLNPQFSIGGEMMIMVTQFASAVSLAELDEKIANLSEHHFTIIRAIDMLLGGY
jgi:toxin CcdB